MNNTLPIIIKPSRFAWAVWTLVWGVLFFVALDDILNPAQTEEWIEHAIFVVSGLALLPAAWNLIVAPPRMIIDENGIGGRLVGGSLVGAKRITWDDVIDARLLEKYSHAKKHNDIFVVLNIHNPGGKYRIGYKWLPFIPKGRHNFSFIVTNAWLDGKNAQDIVAIINTLTKTTLAERQGMSKSPFAAD